MPAARDVNIAFIGHGVGFGQRQAFFVDAKLLAPPLLARLRVERGDAFVEEIEAAVEEDRRAIVVERVRHVRICARKRGHHLDFALKLALPQLAPRAQVEDVDHGFLLKPLARFAMRIARADRRQQVRVRVVSHLHDRAAHLIAQPDGITRQ